MNFFLTDCNDNMNQLAKKGSQVTFAPEGSVSTEKSIGNDTNTPYVDRLAMSNLLQDLGRNISRCSTGCHEHVVPACQDLAQSKVRDHQPCVLCLVVEQQVLRLQVAVHNIQLVQVFNSQQNLINQT